MRYLYNLMQFHCLLVLSIGRFWCIIFVLHLFVSAYCCFGFYTEILLAVLFAKAVVSSFVIPMLTPDLEITTFHDCAYCCMCTFDMVLCHITTELFVVLHVLWITTYGCNHGKELLLSYGVGVDPLIADWLIGHGPDLARTFLNSSTVWLLTCTALLHTWFAYMVAFVYSLVASMVSWIFRRCHGARIGLKHRLDSYWH